MSDLNYAYAVARIRVLEKYLLSDSDIEQMIAMPSDEAVLAFLKERGWGDESSAKETPETVLSEETAKTNELIRELKVEPEVLEVFSYQEMYHNLKAAVKEACSQDEHPGVFLASADYGREKMLRIIQEQAYDELPAHMRKCAEEAFQTLLHTSDGQLCDIIIDRATLEAIAETGRKAKEPIVRDYADMFVSVADIKIAVRSAQTGKTREFMERAMVSSPSVDAGRLIRAASSGKDEIIGYLAGTRFAGAAEALGESPSAFERWCDNQIIETIKPQKYNPFSAGPIVAYKLARENEIRMARIILTAKANGLPDTAIRERARKMYV
ncbi:MAG: V-type ATPase subunit [Lachnospiraceae bacterium]|nr:V-type ATPase subunit [Lachnospiraceae bacterium]